LAQKISATFVDNNHTTLDANLVSIVLSVTRHSDQSSDAEIKMAYFWIANELNSRSNKLLAHSSLPTAASSTKLIQQALQEVGVYNDNFTPGAESLAHIKMKTTINTSTSVDSKLTTHTATTTLLEGKFSSLSINYNPATMSTILGLLGKSTSTSTSTATATATTKSTASVSAAAAHTTSSSLFHSTFKMDTFNISLLSPLDDEPLFNLKMSSSKLALEVENSDAMALKASLGDFSLSTPGRNSAVNEGERAIFTRSL